MSQASVRSGSALTVIMLLAAGAGHSLDDVSQGAGRIDYRIEIPAGDNDPAHLYTCDKDTRGQAWPYVVYIHEGFMDTSLRQFLLQNG